MKKSNGSGDRPRLISASLSAAGEALHLQTDGLYSKSRTGSPNKPEPKEFLQRNRENPAAKKNPFSGQEGEACPRKRKPNPRSHPVQTPYPNFATFGLIKRRRKGGGTEGVQGYLDTRCAAPRFAAAAAPCPRRTRSPRRLCPRRSRGGRRPALGEGEPVRNGGRLVRAVGGRWSCARWRALADHSSPFFLFFSWPFLRDWREDGGVISDVLISSSTNSVMWTSREYLSPPF
jgi:hypothetical protein